MPPSAHVSLRVEIDFFFIFHPVRCLFFSFGFLTQSTCVRPFFVDEFLIHFHQNTHRQLTTKQGLTIVSMFLWYYLIAGILCVCVVFLFRLHGRVGSRHRDADTVGHQQITSAAEHRHYHCPCSRLTSSSSSPTLFTSCYFNAAFSLPTVAASGADTGSCLIGHQIRTARLVHGSGFVAMGVDYGATGGQVPQNLERGDCPPPRFCHVAKF